jgi:curved DNA-binding protein CbpA
MRGATSVLLCALIANIEFAVAGTLYDELEIAPSASSKEIREAYRRLALKHHPDKSNLADSTARFIRLAEAYEVLSKADKRAAYDRKLRFHSSARPSPPSSPSAGRKAHADTDEYAFTFSLRDALEIFERFVLVRLPDDLKGRYQLAKVALSAWPGFTLPLPTLLQNSEMFRAAMDLVDWGALGLAAKNALRSAFEDEKGDVDWLKVAGATAAGASVVAAALDASDDGNRTAQLKSLAAKGLSWLGSVLAKRTEDTDKDES